MVPFNRPHLTGEESTYLNDAIKKGKFSGDGDFTKLCHSWLEKKTGAPKVLLTTSCTHGLEMAALLCGVQTGDEVIMPSFTFVSTANAFVLRGAKIIFVDVEPGTMNMDIGEVEKAITPKTKVVVPVHYGGVGCEMDKLMALSKKHKFFVVEDAAQGLNATYKGKHLGAIGHLGTFSFHETKNIHCGEGGALLINDPTLMERAEIIREKGTNRAKFLRGQVDKYTWVDIGSSYLASELNAAFLYPQLLDAEKVTQKRLTLWRNYYSGLQDLAKQGFIELPEVAEGATHNGHIFFIKCKDIEERHALIKYLRANEIQSVFHYVPLHSAKAGLTSGVMFGEDKFTTKESERLLRLPMFFSLTEGEVRRTCEKVIDFYTNQ